MATTRHEVANTLYDKGVTPLHPKYSFHVETYLVKKFGVDQTNLSNANESRIRDVASRFSSKAKKFCLENKKHVPTMLKKKDKWFSEVIENPVVLEQSEQPKSKPKKKPGRPKKSKRGPKKKDYNDSKTRSKSDKAGNLAKDHSFEELLAATLRAAQAAGDQDSAFALKFLKNNPTEGASIFRQTMKNTLEPVVVCSAEESLALIIELRLTQK